MDLIILQGVNSNRREMLQLIAGVSVYVPFLPWSLARAVSLILSQHDYL